VAEINKKKGVRKREVELGKRRKGGENLYKIKS